MDFKMRDRDLTLVYESILLEYSQGTLNKLIEKFKSENNIVDEEQLKYYINRFDQIRNSPRFINFIKQQYPDIKDPKNIFNYTFAQLEAGVDQMPTKEVKSVDNNSSKDLELLVNRDGIKIYKAHNKQGCVDAVHAGILRKNNYTWCVSRKETGSNMYNTYRYKEQSTFYFIDNTNLPISDKFHTIVLQARNDGMFYITDAINSLNHSDTWEAIVKLIPWIAPFKQYFNVQEYSEQEQEVMQTRYATAKNFPTLSYKYKLIYLQNEDKKLFVHDFLALPIELQNIFINSRVTTTFFDYIGYNTQSLYDSYLQFFENTNKNVLNRLYTRINRNEIVNNSAVLNIVDAVKYATDN